MSTHTTQTGGVFDISGRTAVITGASRGIGLHIASGLMRQGANVITLQRGELAPGTRAAGAGNRPHRAGDRRGPE